ncbi:Aminomethyltransferase, mitochondrial [Friedmanniomyces endolithicus]|uniref:Aminomethyltransferase n=1 Tax=Friedmanniomyces endolithicus TaxID=329885 RepID=A0AAN6F9N7_9PEZI|nr:Aminomethyltransferase, mitochondrial [Friedmanniomyces endolithicus]KAK0272641.1 Aminomethyltransferase, mitochondrial [Friedmanniomyces endolithicus]KAK0307737.1 Aminomethyltransferase, mitochondrial [Friedmanniomyces endolithicus]KAK0926082.1 Aminomethyltransferase, mitochondrial [Friedmanniomyces endolithicus]KAK1000501.1 Aminomethyltransferase, mitochondrial [Friedmanniomyces endolithicus]
MSSSRTVVKLARSLERTARPQAPTRQKRCLTTTTSSRPRLQTKPQANPPIPKPHTTPRPSTHQPSRHQSTLPPSATAQPPPFPTPQNPGKTALHPLHLSHHATLVPFASFSMPVSYPSLSHPASHAWTRSKASLFDVGHMVQYHISGPGAEGFLERVTPMGIRELGEGEGGLGVLLRDGEGGLVDDCLITRLEGGGVEEGKLFYLVANAGCREKDYTFLCEEVEKWGPLAGEILEEALAKECRVDVKTWYFGRAKHITLALGSGESLPIVASRGGYTGEDGFELSVHPSQTLAVAEALLDGAGEDRLRLAGLGARDSLRLEAGMCLYGHDLDESTTPVEASLSWIIPKRRRTLEGSEGRFNGAEAIIPQLTPKSKGGAGVSKRRVGLIVQGAPAREGAEVVDEAGGAVGTVTSGCPSPTLGKNIAMAYVKDGLHKIGTELQVLVRGKKRKAVVTKMPFVPSRYWKGGATPG